jgi:nucleoside-diphosphate-sugar epimerase
MIKKIFITGGAGYVGTVLSNYLLEKGYKVTVYDLMIYGANFKSNKNLQIVKGDIRDKKKIKNFIKNHDAVIHLACISNDPSFELNPNLGKEINYDSFEPLVKISKDEGIKRFIYASSSSVYGVKKELNVTEEMKLEPLTDYSKYKALCEEILIKYSTKDFVTLIVRPATVCGYSPRQRLDLVVNILTNLAYHKRKILVYGGDQLRPNIHINDMIRAYELFLKVSENKINQKVYNVGFDNMTVNQLAEEVKFIIGSDVSIEKVLTNDNRSYHISSKKIFSELGFENKFTIKDAVKDLQDAFIKKNLINCLDNEEYFNIKKMKSLNLK